MEKLSMLRREEDILERIENVKRIIQMENTILTAKGLYDCSRYYQVTRDGKKLGDESLLDKVRDEIQLQLLSIVALCYGDNPDIGEPMPMLEWNYSNSSQNENVKDMFRDMFEKCLQWNA